MVCVCGTTLDPSDSMKCDAAGKLAPIRFHWVKALRSGVGTVPLDSVSIMES